MIKRAMARFCSISFGVLCLLCATSLAQNQGTDPDLTAHEWGTFTSIAGRDGHAVKWLPLNGSTDLPRFVEHLQGAAFKTGLRGTIRMETPVLYFYSPRETPVSVRVSFSRGVITEWYPRASSVDPNPGARLFGDALYKLRHRGSIAWRSVTVSPNLVPSLPGGSHSEVTDAGFQPVNQYYAARETSAAPLVVKTASGEQQEKFLFYRGVSAFSLPLSAMVTAKGAIHISNLTDEDIPSVILFERRGDKLGYRLGGALPGEMSLDPPEMTATLESMSRDLQDVLTAQGLYADEARAMVETWRQSWFEEGSRLFYIVPEHFLHRILPLTIDPVPSQIVRVFVGRLELVTPVTMQDVGRSLVAHDLAGLQKYSRFLEPILDVMKQAEPARAGQYDKDLDSTYNLAAARAQPTQ